MTDSPRLERGYRRILACYPRAFRQESEEEILAVLLATAQPGQQRVGPAEARRPARLPGRDRGRRGRPARTVALDGLRQRPGAPRGRVAFRAVHLVITAGVVAEALPGIAVYGVAAGIASGVMIQLQMASLWLILYPRQAPLPYRPHRQLDPVQR
jgi:hypothetical protein